MCDQLHDHGPDHVWQKENVVMFAIICFTTSAIFVGKENIYKHTLTANRHTVDFFYVRECGMEVRVYIRIKR